MSNRCTVSIPTLDPRVVKGVRSVTEVAYDAARKAGFDTKILFNAVPWCECLTVNDLLNGNWDIPVQSIETDSLEGVSIGRVFPEAELFNYLLNLNHWRTYLEDADTILAVGGPCLTGLPAAISNQEFTVWFGTTVEDEREAQKSNYDIPVRARYEFIRPILRRYERYVLRKATKVYAQSSYTRKRAIDMHNLPPEEVEVLPCAVDTTSFRPDPARANSSEVVFVGRYNDPRKNLPLLLNAFSKVVDDIPEAQLTLIGSDMSSSHQSKIDALGIKSHINLLGEVDSVVPYLQRAAVFAYPSRQEGFGIAALEALSCGTPVVSTRCGGPKDFVIDGETGYLVDKNDVDAFSDCIVKLLNGDEQRQQFAEAGRALVRSKFSWELVSDRLKSIFEEQCQII